MSYITKFYQQRKQRIVYAMGGQCALCGYKKNIQALEMHHINPEEKDFTFSNTKEYHNWEELSSEMKKCILLCANCHREVHYPLEGEVFNLQSSYDETKGKEISLEIQKEKKKTEYFCIDCGKKISYKATRCQKCAELHNRIVERPDRETFKKEIREQPFTVLGKKYGVSDNAIRKWCDNYNLPRTKKEINSYKDSEWQTL